MAEEIDNAAYVEALLRERESYVAAGRPERVKEVDAELTRLGARPPAKKKATKKSAENTGTA
jgi:hypothetical protein